MHVRLFAVCFCILWLSATAARSQVPARQQPAANSTAETIVRRVDGGAGNGIMQSIFIPPKAGAPFNLTLSTEWTRPLPGGGTWTLVNERHIMRDSKGRIYQERWILVPKGGPVKSAMNVFQITDPELHTWFNCEVRTKICELLQYTLTTEQSYLPALGPSRTQPNEIGHRTQEDLGPGNPLGVDTHGFRETLTIKPGELGNDRPMVNVREFWWSPQLAINLVSIVDDWQSGNQVFTVKDLSTTEPDVSYFNIPADYKVVDHRTEHSTTDN